MELVIASSNLHKIREFRDMLKSLKSLDLLSLLHFPDYEAPEENGKSFQENAVLKAEHAAKALQKWVLADDSGLVIPSLRVYSGINCTSGSRQSPGVDRSQATQYSNMGSLAIDQPRELSRGPDVQFLPVQSLNPNVEKGFHPLRLVWGDHHRVHTFVCQGGNSQKTHFSHENGAIAITFELSLPPQEEDREKCRELSFFVDAHEGLEFLISEHKASTFLVGETVSMTSGNRKLSMVFNLDNGEGRFLGHRMLSNRPSQINAKGNQRYEAYDWQLFLRTVSSRSDVCLMKIILHVS